MVPWNPLPTFSGGPADVVKAYNNCIGTLQPITEANVQKLEHLVVESDKQGLADLPFPQEIALDLCAREKGASAIINLRTEVQYKGFWLWKKPSYMRISGCSKNKLRKQRRKLK